MQNYRVNARTVSSREAGEEFESIELKATSAIQAAFLGGVMAGIELGQDPIIQLSLVVRGFEATEDQLVEDMNDTEVLVEAL